MEQTERKRLYSVVAGAAVAVLAVIIVGIGAISGRASLTGARAPQEGPESAAKQLDAARSSAPQSARAAATPVCETCGTVESVRIHVVKGDRGAAGSAAGSAGVGAIGRQQTVHRVTIRMDDGSYRTISQPVEPGYGVGEKVRIIDGSVVASK
jgi:hypothetical protein